VEASSGACEAEFVASLAASLGNDVTSSGPLGCVLGLRLGGWLDSPCTGACVLGLAEGWISRHVEAEWVLAVRKGSLNSSPIFVPSVLNFFVDVEYPKGYYNLKKKSNLPDSISQN
jgi:hypothetical protein